MTVNENSKIPMLGSGEFITADTPVPAPKTGFRMRIPSSKLSHRAARMRYTSARHSYAKYFAETPMTASILWFTGLSASGKTTLCLELQRRFILQQTPCVVLDGDHLRLTLSKDLGFSRQDREENVRRLASLAQEHAAKGDWALVAAIAPYRDQRAALRAKSPAPFIEVFVDSPLIICEKRDPKGLYRRARAGLLLNFTGIDDPYEPPLNPAVHCFTAVETVEESCDKVWLHLARETRT